MLRRWSTTSRSSRASRPALRRPTVRSFKGSQLKGVASPRRFNMAEPSKISDMLQSRERWGRNLVSLLLVGALGAVGLYYWGMIVPWLIEVASDTLKLAG